ncbi:MAG: ABC transporter ATP-binding protein [Gammaproteobacteria bacterium]|nr:ABC transporter ATP-binding protein [Gammaproteobacteria bacterium]MDE0258090.1 ABC transporter ATP-binding protein [Gammaproteobacteria bacterium]
MTPEPPEDISLDLLRVRGLHTRFLSDRGLVHAVNDVSFSVRRGEALALVGESGCGKTASMLSVLRLLPPHRTRVRADEVSFKGRDLLGLDDEEMRRVRGPEIGMIFQDPRASLNPVLTIGRQLTESLEVHLRLGRRAARDRAIELLGSVGIPRPGSRFDDYPHQFSGGMCQRVMIAIALACEPSLLIADEPTTALDATIQAQILDLVSELRATREMAMIWITHDLSVVANLADRVAVMYGGSIVETAGARRLFAAPAHPYTRGLLASLPALGGEGGGRLTAIPGQPPDMTRLPVGCAFAARCPHAFDRCIRERPPLLPAGKGAPLGEQRARSSEKLAFSADAGARAACWWDG